MIFHIKILLILLIIISSCSSNKVVNNHGTSFIDVKSKDLLINKSNKNDIYELLGPPSIKSAFDNNTWIYIERKKESTSIFKLGKKKLKKNNVLVVEIDKKGLLKKKTFYDLNNMNDLDFDKNLTQSGYEKNSYVYSVLTSLRQKINSPIKRKKSAN